MIPSLPKSSMPFQFVVSEVRQISSPSSSRSISTRGSGASRTFASSKASDKHFNEEDFGGSPSTATGASPMFLENNGMGAFCAQFEFEPPTLSKQEEAKLEVSHAKMKRLCSHALPQPDALDEPPRLQGKKKRKGKK